MAGACSQSFSTNFRRHTVKKSFQAAQCIAWLWVFFGNSYPADTVLSRLGKLKTGVIFRSNRKSQLTWKHLQHFSLIFLVYLSLATQIRNALSLSRTLDMTVLFFFFQCCQPKQWNLPLETHLSVLVKSDYLCHFREKELLGNAFIKTLLATVPYRSYCQGSRRSCYKRIRQWARSAYLVSTNS